MKVNEERISAMRSFFYYRIFRSLNSLLLIPKQTSGLVLESISPQQYCNPACTYSSNCSLFNVVEAFA